MEETKDFSMLLEKNFTKSKFRILARLSLILFFCTALQLKANTSFEVSTVELTSEKIDDQQKRTITGKVMDADGVPMGGVNILVEGTNNGVQTNFDGDYNISVGENDKNLIFSFIGYNTVTIAIDGKSIINAEMTESNNLLDEVVVTGYQRISRERATGAYDVIPTVEIKNNVNQSIGSVLQGIAPGIEITQDADGKIDLNNVVIRGIGSIDPGSSTTPLLVVDGFPISGGFNTINPNDVASITVLKDAAAASIWGARAGNGVIVIETKKGKESDGIQVEFSTFVKMGSRINLEKNFSRADSQTTLDFESTIWTPLGHGVNSTFVNNYPPPATLYDNLLVSRGGNTNYRHGARAYYDAYVGDITQSEFASTIDRLKGINSYDDIDKYLLAAPLQQTYNLAVSTSGKKSTTRLSAIYNKNQNAFINDVNDQVLININNQYKVTDWLDFDLAAMLDNAKSENSGINFGLIQGMDPYEKLIQDDGSYAGVRRQNGYDNRYMEYFANNMTNLPYDDIRYNPLRDARDTEMKQQRTNFRINAALNINIAEGLKFRPSVQYEKFRTEYNNYYGAETSRVQYEVLNGTDKNEYNPAAGTIGEFHIPVGAQLTNSENETTSTTYRGVLTYDKVFKELHAISVLAGIERTSSTTYNTFAPRTYGFNKENNSSQRTNNDPWTALWDYYPPGLSTTWSYGQSDRRFISYFGNASYTYNNKYTVSGSVRSDGANFIVTDESMRFNPMWSAGLSWNIKNEEFLKNVDAIDNLKLRITNGVNGNLVGTVATEPTISISATPDYYTGQFNAFLISLGNPTLRWEKVNTWNIGADFSIFNRSLYGSVELYNKKSEDLIATVSLASTIGQSTGTFNVGGMTNKGVELNLASDINFNSGVLWTTNLVMSHNKSEVTSLSTDYLSPFWMGGEEYVEGRPYLPVYAFEYGGMQKIDSQDELYPTVIAQEDGEVVGMDAFITGDGRDQLKYMGTAVAPTILGWNNTVMFKNFSLSARFLGKFGHVFRRPTYNYSAFVQNGTLHEDVKGLMAGEHDAMGIPKIPLEWDNFTYRWSNYIPNLDTLIEDASHIRLQQIYFSYDFAQEYLSSTGIKGLRVFMQAENLGNIWTANSYNIDPEYIRGMSRRPEKTFSLGVNFKF